MQILSIQAMAGMYGGALSLATILAWMMIAAAAAGILKILTSDSGRVDINGLKLQWRN